MQSYGHVISILLLAVFFRHTAASCTAGTYLRESGQGCRQCLQGTWSPNSNSYTSCSVCPVNTYSNRQLMATGCVSCPDNSYTDSNGRWSSFQCTCGAGRAWTTNAQVGAVCGLCTYGTYNEDGVNLRECLLCDAGFQSTSTGTSCQECPDGEDTQGVGDACACIFPKRRRSSRVGCVLYDCAAGYYVIDHGISGSTDPTCSACPVGHFISSRSMHDECPPCPVGTYTATVGTVDCADCNAGTYTSSEGSEVCSTCPDGTSSGPGSNALTDCKCMAGYVAASDGVQCSECGPGTYTSAVGSVSCDVCPGGTYKSIPGAGNCSTCPDGTSSISGSDALMDCKCVVGYVAASDGVQCSECAAGSRSSNGDEDGRGSRTCTTCPTGTYAGPGSGRCISCPIHSNTHGEAAVAASYCECIQGYYSNDFVVDDASCIACEENTYKDSHGSGLCTSCPNGTESVSTSDSIDNCNCIHGFGGWTAHGCTLCTSGTYVYKTTNGNGECTPCPTNTISDAGSTELSQCICKVGYTHIENGLACAECEEGTFKNITGAVECTICPYHRSSAVGSVSESDCKCVAGYYGGSCIDCPTGTVSTFDAATIHDCLCMAGWFRANEICVPCPIGSYKLGIGDGICTNCLVV